MGDLVRKSRCHCISSKLQRHRVFTCESPAIQSGRTKGVSGLSKSYALMPHLSQQEYPYTGQESCQLHTDEVCSVLECLEVRWAVCAFQGWSFPGATETLCSVKSLLTLQDNPCLSQASSSSVTMVELPVFIIISLWTPSCLSLEFAISWHSINISIRTEYMYTGTLKYTQGCSLNM